MTALFRPEAVEARRQSWLGAVTRIRLPSLRSAGAAVPVWLQSEAAECGLACLAMIAGVQGQPVDLAALRQRFPLSLRGATLADLVRMSEALGLQARPLRAELEDLPLLQTPCILHWDMNHFVVLVGMRGGVATIHDPARGRRRAQADELSRSFTGVALELQPQPGFAAPAPAPRIGLRQLLGRVDGLRGAAARIFALALLLEGLLLLSPLFMQRVVDDVLVRGDRAWLMALGLGFAGLVLIQAGTAAARAWAVLKLSAALGRQWMGDVFAHLLRLPVAWFERRHAGDVWSRFGAVQQIQRTLTTQAVEAVLDGLMVLLTLGVMLAYSPRLTLVVLVAVAAYAGLRRAFFGPQREAMAQMLVHEARQSSHFLETLRGMQAIKLFNAQALREARFSSLVVDTLNADIGVRRLQIRAAVLHRLLFGLERVAVVGLGALLVLDGALSLGMLFAFIAFKEQFALRVSGLIDKAVELKMLRLQIDRLSDILLAAPEPAAAASAMARVADDAAAIELRGVSFRHGDAEGDVLRDISLRIEPGESVAIVGPSGCGKTTLVKLMLGVLQPQSGEVQVGGQPLRPEGLAAWRAQVGAVMQDEPLFAGTVADNIAFFDPQPDLAWIERCATVAGVHDEIAAMPMAYQTLVGEAGASLSGGQKQRVLLARALYKRPAVLVLDEATSALDVEGERRMNQAVRALSMTRIIVAHRPETVASADRVIGLRQGRMVQDLRAVRGKAPAA